MLQIMEHNIAIIGYGGMGSWHHKQLAEVENMNVTAVYDINPQKVLAAISGGLKGYYTLDELLNDKSIDIVIIATPNNFHKELSISVLMAGKNVICEKPVMMNAIELAEVLEIARAVGRVFTVHQNRRWDKDFCIVKKVLDENMIGKPFYIESRVQGSKGVPGDWRCVKKAGGGMLLDWGVHLLDQILWMVKSPVSEIYAQLLSVKFPDVDDNFKVLLKFENNLSVLIEVDTYTFIPLPRWHVSADNGTLVINDWDCNGEILKANLVEFKWEQGIVYTSAGPTKTMAPRPVETIDRLPLPEMNPDCRDYYTNVAQAIEGKAELIVTPKQMMRVMKIIDAIFLSAKTGECIKGVDTL
jgi:scyllo-inositol 2-dehydrogenase (NADP+)